MPVSTGKRRHKNRKTLKQDVTAGLVADKIYGGKRVRIRGGQATGSLWHILSNGRLVLGRSRAFQWRGTGFLDKAMQEIDQDTGELLDIAMSNEFKRMNDAQRLWKDG